MQYLFGAILIAGILAIIFASISFFQKKYTQTNMVGLGALLLIIIGGIGLAASINLKTYSAFTDGDKIARVNIKRVGPNNFDVVIMTKQQPNQEYFINGTAAQLTARILDNNKYRLEQLSAVQATASDQVQTVYELTEHKGLDVAGWFKTNKLSTVQLPLTKATSYLITIVNGKLAVRSKIQLELLQKPHKPQSIKRQKPQQLNNTEPNNQTSGTSRRRPENIRRRPRYL